MQPSDLDEVQTFLDEADLTLSGLDSPALWLWIARDAAGRIAGTTGFEIAESGKDVLIRSVAVAPDVRGTGFGLVLARFAMNAAAEAGATTSWLFSRRSGAFWQRLGFERGDRDELALRLAGTHQVQLFRETGQLEKEVAWMRSLAMPVDTRSENSSYSAT